MVGTALAPCDDVVYLKVAHCKVLAAPSTVASLATV